MFGTLALDTWRQTCRSSRNLTPSEGGSKSDVSTGSTRKLLTEMEMGAYNSSSTSPGRRSARIFSG